MKREPTAPSSRRLRALVVLQALILAVLVLGDIGFDKPGRYGLDFDHLVALGVGYLVALAAGLAIAVRCKNGMTGVSPVILLLDSIVGAVSLQLSGLLVRERSRQR